jgi:hypothetical protein
MTSGSMKMRVQNFESLEGGGGLPHAARQSGRILEQYRDLSEAELRARVMDCLEPDER